MTVPRHATVRDERQLRAGAIALARQCEIMARILKRTGLPPPRDFPANFSGLAKIIIGQQLSIHSAAAIWKRVEQALSPLGAEAISASDDAHLKALGLSNGKVRTLRALARAVEEGLDFRTLNMADEQTIIERLTAVHGIGPWTADIYILFALERKDAFAAGDLALQLAVQHHLNLSTRPSAAELEQIAERWRPSRAIAARLLWADYAFARREPLASRQNRSQRQRASS